jgi:hypothetical protein
LEYLSEVKEKIRGNVNEIYNNVANGVGEDLLVSNVVNGVLYRGMEV